MTQHILQEDTHEDQQIMRRLAVTIGGFMLATAVMATIIAVVMG
jgi:hypothetical protein